jgi:putative MATE family efflux protein
MRTEERLGTESLTKLMFSLAIPNVIAQLVNLLYNLVDRVYIGHIAEVGDLALTGLGLCSPIIFLISGFAAFAGAGGAPLAAIELGRGDRNRAQRIMANSFLMLLVFSVVLTTVFLVWKRPVLFLFGASDNTIGFADDYLTIYLCGTLFVQLALGLNPFISAQGNARVAMLSVLIGSVANIILDPIFIFALDMGVQGAALATVISQFFSAAWVTWFLLSKKSSIRLQFSRMCPIWSIIGRIAALGVSPWIMQVTEGLVSAVFNGGLQTYGNDLYVGAMTILNSLSLILFAIAAGFTQGVQPIISYNFGARNRERVIGTFKRLLISMLTLSLVSYAVCALFARPLAALFNDNPALIELVGQTLPIFMAGMSIFGIQISIMSTFVGLGQAKRSVFVASLRKLILLIPLALILPRYFGVMGIFWAQPIADVISVLTASTLFLCSIRKILRDGPPQR